MNHQRATMRLDRRQNGLKAFCQRLIREIIGAAESRSHHAGWWMQG
jgi:hypothetical protein